jgi:hypothetical protein
MIVLVGLAVWEQDGEFTEYDSDVWYAEVTLGGENNLDCLWSDVSGEVQIDGLRIP